MIRTMDYEMSENKHISVMGQEVLSGLSIKPDGFYVDATFGRGGHASAILDQLGEQGRLIVIDRDPQAIEVAEQLASQDKRVSVHQGRFSELETFCATENRVGQVDGVLMDIGVSSPQLDEAKRGFSFRSDGPLDMRMDPTQGIGAAEWLANAEESEIAHVLKMYGEERFSRRIARGIVEARVDSPIMTTLQLAEIVKTWNPSWEKHKHPATRSFQGIRIFINNELEELAQGLEQAVKVLCLKGRLVVISFHSLEDRIVKHFIQKGEKGMDIPMEIPLREAEIHTTLRRIGSQQKATSVEIQQNPRARSAVLRVAEKVGEPQ